MQKLNRTFGKIALGSFTTQYVTRIMENKPQEADEYKKNSLELLRKMYPNVSEEMINAAFEKYAKYKRDVLEPFTHGLTPEGKKLFDNK